MSNVLVVLFSTIIILGGLYYANIYVIRKHIAKNQASGQQKTAEEIIRAIRMEVVEESPRIEIFWKIVQCEHKADAKANKIYPIDPMVTRDWEDNIIKNAKLSDELMYKYRDEVARKYGLTKEDISAIIAEGIRKNWPTPKK